MTGILFPDALILALARRPFLGIFAVSVSLALFLLSPLFIYHVWKRGQAHAILDETTNGAKDKPHA